MAYVQQEGYKTIFGPQEGETAEAIVTWGLHRIDQRDLPLDRRFEPGEDGAGIHTYTIDTGLDADHPDFAGRVGEGFSVFGGEPIDGHGHGTHVTGTIAGLASITPASGFVGPVEALIVGYVSFLGADMLFPVMLVILLGVMVLGRKDQALYESNHLWRQT